MYCKNCGRSVDDTSSYCNNCGARIDNKPNADVSEDNSNLGFAILGFFIPIVGLILFLIYEEKKPKRAKSAGKGALIGFITKIVLAIILVILYVVFATSLFNNISNNIPAIGDVFSEETTDKILEKDVDVSFGEFKVTNNGYYSETSLDITVKNKAEEQCTYYITIEAVDANGARIDTDMIYADRLGAGQEVYLKAFEYVDQEKLNQFKNATFKVLEINKYDY
ncbi:zinc-ribbon domain-containing protein [uncultured Ruminococcus sp.]|uniref:zinc-ribbon domain-containing protein n=1 Tax=uncultured Ruminococcus sp. TaxID=165186 RepID=UPI0025D87F3D|nr:zinc-ribbon domain-containing protein [uncultured Ruminococcus sp.]